MTKAKLTKFAIGKIIGRYLDDVRDGTTGDRVHLGPGKSYTTDPEVVREHAEKIMAQAAESTSSVKALRLTQRALDLRDAADRLELAADDASNEDLFVEHAAQWARDNDISYAAFRERGVPADVLKRAGITRAG